MKLADLTPVSVFESVRDAINEHVQRLVTRTSIGPVPFSLPCDALQLTIADITNYAQLGIALDAPAIDYVQSIAEVMSIAPGDGLTYSAEGLLSDDLQTPWGVVCRAALARSELDAGNAVSIRELSVLSGITIEGVRRCIRVGELTAAEERDDSRPGAPATLIAASEALRWLSGRGLRSHMGFEDTPLCAREFSRSPK